VKINGDDTSLGCVTTMFFIAFVLI